MGLTILDLAEAKRALPPRVVQEAAPAIFPFQGGADFGYRRLNQTPNVRDLFPATQDHMQRVAYYLYCTNSTAKRCVEILVDFICGEAVTVEASDRRVQEVLDGFWNDPWNNLDEFIPDLVQTQSVFGEALVQCYTNEISGATRISATDPMWIDSVEYATLAGDPGRAVGPPQTVVLRSGWQEREQKRLRVVMPDEDPLSEAETYGQLRGECFYWPLRKSRAATRGISDLFPGSDLFDAYDQFLWAVVEQAKSQGAFIWDVLLKGYTQEQINQWLKDHPSGPRSGAVRPHNENVEWNAVTPQIHASDKSELGRFIRNTIISGFGFPEHWFADGGNANRATAAEMGEPVLKMLSRRQRGVKFMLEAIFRYVISAKIAAGVLPESVDQEFEVQMPELSVKDQAKIATAFQSTTQALSLAKQEGWVDKKTAAKTVAIQIGQFGVEADAEEMLAEAEKEGEAERLRDYRTPNPEPPLPGGRGSDGGDPEPRAQASGGFDA